MLIVCMKKNFEKKLLLEMADSKICVVICRFLEVCDEHYVCVIEVLEKFFGKKGFDLNRSEKLGN